MLQLYQGKKEATFVKLAFEDQERRSGGLADETLYDRISVDLTRFKKDILTKLKHPKVRKDSFYCIEVFVRTTDHKPAYFDILLADFAGELTDELINDTIEEVPFEQEPIEEKEVNMESIEPYVRDIALKELQSAACDGNAGNYQVILQFILSNENKGTHLLNDLQSSLLMLVTTMVAKNVSTEDCLDFKRYVLGPEYTIQLDNEMLQLYQGKKEATFVKLAFEDQERRSGGLADETLYDRISVDLTRFKKDILTKLKHPKVRKDSFYCIEVFVRTTDHKPAYFDILLADFAGELTDELINDTIEEVPFEQEPIEEKEVNMESIEPYVRDIALKELQSAACDGNAGNYQVILQFILSNENKGTHLLNDLQSSLLMLVTTMVAKNVSTEDCLEGIVVTLLDLCFQTPQSKLKLLDRLFRLQCFSLAQQIVKGMQVSPIPDYFEALLQWQLWCFLPQETAHEILSMINPLKNQLASPDNLIPETGCPRETSLHTAIVGYAVHFADLLLHHFINEVHETRIQTFGEGLKADYTIGQLKACNLSSPYARNNDGTRENVYSGSNKP